MKSQPGLSFGPGSVSNRMTASLPAYWVRSSSNGFQSIVKLYSSNNLEPFTYIRKIAPSDLPIACGRIAVNPLREILLTLGRLKANCWNVIPVPFSHGQCSSQAFLPSTIPSLKHATPLSSSKAPVHPTGRCCSGLLRYAKPTSYRLISSKSVTAESGIIAEAE